MSLGPYHLLLYGESGLQVLLPLNDRPSDGLTIHIEQRRKLILGQGTNALRWLLARQGPESPLESADLAHSESSTASKFGEFLQIYRVGAMPEVQIDH